MTTRARVSRREVLAAFAGSAAGWAATPEKSRVAITIDDLRWDMIPAPMRRDANQRLLAALDQNKMRATLFVIGERGDTPQGCAILSEWSERGHIVGNHTWTHPIYDNVPDPAGFGQELLRCHAFVRQFPTFRQYFRFPALKEGATRERRDWMRAFLKSHEYKNGAVTIDTSDWYYDQRLRKCLNESANFDVHRFRAPYLAHIWDRATYYDRLAREVLGRTVSHTILLHYNLLNSYFLGDVMAMFQERGWQLVSAANAFQDEIFVRQPDTVPAGESLAWALAKETGRYDARLRYPGEDDSYEKPILDRLGL